MDKNIEKIHGRLICGCCGDLFKPWEGYVDQDQDRGYGICRSCQADEAKREEEAFDKACALVVSGLKKKANRDRFMNMDREEKYYIIHKLFEEKILTWKIG